MATYSRREVWTHRIEYSVPAEPPFGACWAEVAKAFTAARNDLVTSGVIGPEREMWDDQVKVIPSDDAILIVVELPTERGDE